MIQATKHISDKFCVHQTRRRYIQNQFLMDPIQTLLPICICHGLIPPLFMINPLVCILPKATQTFRLTTPQFHNKSCNRREPYEGTIVGWDDWEHYTKYEMIDVRPQYPSGQWSNVTKEGVIERDVNKQQFDTWHIKNCDQIICAQRPSSFRSGRYRRRVRIKTAHHTRIVTHATFRGISSIWVL